MLALSIAGLTISALFTDFVKNVGAQWVVIASVILQCPLMVDGALQFQTKYTSSNGRRFLTGVLAGFGIGFLLVWLILNYFI